HRRTESPAIDEHGTVRQRSEIELAAHLGSHRGGLETGVAKLQRAKRQPVAAEPNHPGDVDRRVALGYRTKSETDLSAVPRIRLAQLEAMRRGESLVEQHVGIRAVERATARVFIQVTARRQAIGRRGRERTFDGAFALFGGLPPHEMVENRNAPAI